MATNQQRAELQTVLCLCSGDEWHTLGDTGCESVVKPGNYGSWKPTKTRYYLPRIPVEDIFAELARVTPDKVARSRYHRQASNMRLAAKF